MPTATKRAPPPPDSSIECTPAGCAQMCASCLMFLLSLTTISALGVIAGGAFWSAKAMYRITDGSSVVKVVLCGVSTHGNSSTNMNALTLDQWGILKNDAALPECPSA